MTPEEKWVHEAQERLRSATQLPKWRAVLTAVGIAGICVWMVRLMGVLS